MADNKPPQPSLRLNLSSANHPHNTRRTSTIADPPKEDKAPETTSNKKQRVFYQVPPSIPLISPDAHTDQVTIFHERLEFHVLAHQGRWTIQGKAALFLACPSPQLAMHVRDSCKITRAQIQNDSTTAFLQTDPLRYILRKPAASFAYDDDEPSFHADAHAARGTSHMVLGLRAASIASRSGELRVELPTAEPSLTPTQTWLERLDCTQPPDTPYGKRMERVAQLLSQDKHSYMVTLNFELDARVLATNPVWFCTPHPGTSGDSQGPRLWFPCLDASRHRASYELSVTTTGLYGDGLQCVGSVSTQSTSHAHVLSCDEEMIQAVGKDHVDFLQAHRPPENTDLWVTNLWCSHIYTPVPARSLGFAIGPWRILEDPEYFSAASLPELDEEEEEEDEYELNERLEAFLEAAREKGEGIRQVYLAPRFYRPHLHRGAQTGLLPHTLSIDHPPPLTQDQEQELHQLDDAVLRSTVGVPRRALSLMRNVLALPTYLTDTYTQLWIPNGTIASGAFHQCPQATGCFPWFGGAVFDSKMLPPPGSRMPYYAGGRAVQMVQARSAIRGWVTAALPLGGNDDVGMGYLLTLVEAFIMSLYERGHGGQGEGKLRCYH